VYVNWKCCFNVVERGAASEKVKWKTGLSCQVFYCCSGKQVNFGLEINMKETNYLISSQHLPFRINTLC
jgi:hypothetical protein